MGPKVWNDIIHILLVPEYGNRSNKEMETENSGDKIFRSESRNYSGSFISRTEKKRKRKNKRRPSLLKRNGGLQILLQMPQTSCARIPDITAAKMTRVSFLPAAMTMQRQKRSPFSSITVLQYSRKVLL